MKAKFFVSAVVLLAVAIFTVRSYAGSLQPSGPPSDDATRMYTLEQIYVLVTTGTAPTKQTGGFKGPSAGPGAGTMHTLDEIVAKIAVGSTTATAGDVLSGKTFITRIAGSGESAATGTLIKRGLPKTGQETSYATGDDAYYADPVGADIGGTTGSGSWAAWNADGGRYTKQGSSVTIIDNATGLEWVADPTAFGVGGTYTWAAATTTCEGLDFAGHDDWRLPNIKELQSIVDYGMYNPAIDTNFFTSQSSYYWSSTTYVAGTTSAWVVAFYAGGVGTDVKILTYYVRPVRGGP